MVGINLSHKADRGGMLVGSIFAPMADYPTLILLHIRLWQLASNADFVCPNHWPYLNGNIHMHISVIARVLCRPSMIGRVMGFWLAPLHGVYATIASQVHCCIRQYDTRSRRGQFRLGTIRRKNDTMTLTTLSNQQCLPFLNPHLGYSYK